MKEKTSEPYRLEDMTPFDLPVAGVKTMADDKSEARALSLQLGPVLLFVLKIPSRLGMGAA